MGRKKKIINTTGMPDHALETFVRAILPALIADYSNPEVMKRFEEWKKSDEYYEDMKILKPKVQIA